MKRRAPARLALGPDAAAVQGHNAMRVGQADAVAGKLIFAMETLEDAEQLAGVGEIEAHPVVVHEINPCRVRFASANCKFRMLEMTCMLFFTR